MAYVPETHQKEHNRGIAQPSQDPKENDRQRRRAERQLRNAYDLNSHFSAKGALSKIERQQ